MMRGIAILLTLSLLLPLCSCSQDSAAPSAETRSEPIVSLALDGGYTLELYLCGEGKVGSAVDEQTTEYMLADRWVSTYPVNIDSEHSGDVVLTTWSDPTAGTLWFVENSSDAVVEIRVTKPDFSGELTLRKTVYGDSVLSEPESIAPAGGGGYTSETSQYLEGDGLYFQSGRSVRLTDEGSSVYEVSTLDPGTEFSTADGFEFKTRIYRGDATKASAHGACCTSQLVDWTTDWKVSKIVNYDTTSDYLFLADGHYYAKPTDYQPMAGSNKRLVYKTAASFVHQSAIGAGCGAYLRLLGLYLIYTRIESYNDDGYVPNPCTSQWLEKDYGIGAGFYDTRFNTDAILALVYASGAAGEDPEFEQTADRALAFYRNFRDKHGFTVNGCLFAPDYLSADGETAASLSSLNHYLAEGRVLVEAGKQYGREDYIAAGLEIFREIDRSAEMWIKPNGDLWYAVTPDGEMIRDDYVAVTYNDLVAVVSQLNSIGVLESYPGIRALLASKEQWLTDTGNGSYICAHP